MLLTQLRAPPAGKYNARRCPWKEQVLRTDLEKKRRKVTLWPRTLKGYSKEPQKRAVYSVKEGWNRKREDPQRKTKAT